MSLSLEQLLTPVTKEQALQLQIDLLVSLGFTGAGSFQPGSWRRSIMEATAELHANVTQTIVVLAGSGFNDTAEGDGLTLLSKSHYDNERTDPVKTIGVTVVGDPEDQGPFTILASELVVRDTINDFTYRNTGTINVAQGETGVAAEIVAEVGGSDRNVANNTITEVVEGPGGLTVNNPDPGSGSWITTSGADAEGDPALKTRNETKWSTLAKEGSPGNAYKNWALEADDSITRSQVDDQNPRGPGTVDQYVAGNAGPVGPTAVTAVQDYINGDTDGIGRRPVTVDYLTIDAIDLPVVVAGEIFILAAKNTPATQLAINEAVIALFKTIPVGGTKLAAPPATGFVLLGDIVTAIKQIDGVLNPALSSPAADVPVPLGNVATPDLTPAFTFTSV